MTRTLSMYLDQERWNMSLHTKGVMRLRFTVECACDAALAIDHAANRSQAARHARGQGWHQTRKLGWFCPVCAERMAAVNHGARRNGKVER